MSNTSDNFWLHQITICEISYTLVTKMKIAYKLHANNQQMKL
jgi:hypothetical protein